MKVAIIKIATIVAGDWRDPFAKGDAIAWRTASNIVNDFAAQQQFK